MIVINPENRIVILSDLGYTVQPNSTVDLSKVVTMKKIIRSESLRIALDKKWLISASDISKQSISNEIATLDFIRSTRVGTVNKVDFIWDGLALDMCGYGCVTRNVTYNLALDGYKFNIAHPVLYDDHSVMLNPQQVAIMKQLSGFRGDSKVYIWNRSPVSAGVLKELNKYQVIYCVTEAHGLTDYVKKRVRQAQEIWTATNMDIENFKDMGFARVFKVTQGTNLNVYNSNVLPNSNIKKHCKGFVFLGCGENEYRKGYDVLIRAYCRRFTYKDDVTLILMCHGLELERYFRRYNINSSTAPHIMVYRDRYRESEIPEIFACADVFTLGSRGEGWLLPANDIGAMGKPCLLLDYSGYKEFINNDNGWLVPIKKFGRDEQMSSMDPIYHGLKHFPIYDNNFIDVFSDYMFEVYNNREAVKAKGELFKNSIIKNYTWENTCEQIKFRLSEIPISELQIKIRNPKTVTKKSIDKSLPIIDLYMRGGIGDLVKYSAVFKGLKEKYPYNYRVFTRVDNDIISHLDYNTITKVSENYMRSFADNGDCIISLCHLPYIKFNRNRAELMLLKEHWGKMLDKYKLNLAGDESWSGKQLVKIGKEKTSLFSEILGLNISSNDMSVNIKPFPIKQKKYVCICCGSDPLAGVYQTKTWKKEHWEELVSKIKIPVIQVGGTFDFIVRGAINLVGKTTVSEAAAILKNAVISIFTDNGLMHVSKALGKCDIVLWGPTPYNVFGYSSNINIVSENHNCIFNYPDWAIKCKRETHECMESITPDMVYNEIKTRGLL